MNKVQNRFYICQYVESKEKFIQESSRDLTEYFECNSLQLKFGNTLLKPLSERYEIIREIRR